MALIGTGRNSVTAAPPCVFTITPSDTVALAHPIRCLWVSSSGNVAIKTPNEDTVTLPNVAPGGWHAVRATHVLVTGTTEGITILGGY